MTLTAREGYVYTDGRIFGKTVTLGSNDRADRWNEVPEAQKYNGDTAVLNTLIGVDENG